MSPAEIELAFDTFADTDDVRSRQRAFTDLVTRKALPKRSDDTRFDRGFSRWCALLVSPNVTEEHKLLALAELIRAAQVVKKLQTRVAKAIEPAFVDPLPAISVLKDADERLNVARACSLMRAAWLPGYLARAIAAEETGEKTRAALFAALLGRVASMAEALALVTDAFAAVRFETDSPADSMAKRLIRAMAALRPVMLASPLEAGEDAGKKLDGWIRGALRSSGAPQDEQTQIDLAREVALTVHALVRTRFSVSADPDTFAALRYCRAFFPTVSWPTALRATMELVVQDISEALLLLARQEIPNQGLLEQLELACGLKERARAVATQLADKHQELKEHIRDWLRRGRHVVPSSASDTLQESLLQRADASIGLALIESRRLGALDDTLQQVISTLEIYDAAVAAAARTYGEQVRATAAAVLEVAKTRAVDLLGTEGEEIEFTPKYFDLLAPISGRRVVVRRPAIVRRASNHAAAGVVLKGSAE